MFHNLRIKLTLINVLVVGLILLIMMSGIYVANSKIILRQSEQIMRVMAAEAVSGSKSQLPERQRRIFNYFFAKVDKNGQLIDTSPSLPITHEQLALLLEKVSPLSPHKGKVSLNNIESYRYLKHSLTDAGETVYVFVNTRSEKEILRNLLAALIVSGLIGLALTFFGSLFLADRALIPIKKSWQRQKDFIADASHELRTPLAVIQTNLELVLDNPRETVESQFKWLENIQIENKRMTKLVDDLLFLARADFHEEMQDMACFPLDLAVKEALAPFEPVAVKKGITLESSIVPNLSILGNETRLKQLIVILLDNAIKYTPAGGSIVLELKDKGSHIEISVQDSGEGIETVHLEKIFERFYRVDKARSRQSGGTGLGLAIAECIVKEHRGTIKVFSTPGQGTTFQVSLPKGKITH
ncbi:MAG: integral rane sensor signal transduction histidine kinase [Peptococcaceae bacterium]|jgi:signal transduction histidine kinase|nr:integral rane sensor signal transduction histidine kinase [Peptococcaceae bacterium]